MMHERIIAKRPDKDLLWALEYLTEDAEACSLVNGSDDNATKEARKLETVLRRVARQAGYVIEEAK